MDLSVPEAFPADVATAAAPRAAHARTLEVVAATQEARRPAAADQFGKRGRFAHVGVCLLKHASSCIGEANANPRESSKRGPSSKHAFPLFDFGVTLHKHHHEAFWKALRHLRCTPPDHSSPR